MPRSAVSGWDERWSSSPHDLAAPWQGRGTHPTVSQLQLSGERAPEHPSAASNEFYSPTWHRRPQVPEAHEMGTWARDASGPESVAFGWSTAGARRSGAAMAPDASGRLLRRSRSHLKAA